MTCKHCGKGVLMEYPDFYSCLSCRHQTFKEVVIFRPIKPPAAKRGGYRGDTQKPVEQRTSTIVAEEREYIAMLLNVGVSYHKITRSLMERRNYEVSFAPATVKKYYEMLVQ